MNQATLEWDLAGAKHVAQPLDRTGFSIGWDHAQHGLVPPPELLIDESTVAQGWRAAKAAVGRRASTTTRATRVWLALRLQAWQEGVAFDDRQVTAQFIGQIQSDRCPVLRTALGGAAGDPLAAVVGRLNPHAGYEAGNLSVMSRLAAASSAGMSVLDCLRRSHKSSPVGHSAPAEGLDSGAWMRLAALRSYATPMPFEQAVRLPMAVLPPGGVRLLNAPQRLQACLTLPFAAPGWSARARAVGALLPAHTLRHDFNLFIGALAPRVLEADLQTASLRTALEDAWLNERVQRRWQHFMLALGEAGAQTLLERTGAGNFSAGPTRRHATAPASAARQSAHRANALHRAFGDSPVTAGVRPRTPASPPAAPGADGRRARPQLA